MYDAYIARTADRLVYAFFYSEENGICQRIYNGGRWSAALSIAVEAVAGFTVSLGPDGMFYILYRDGEGFPHLLCGGKDGYEALSIEERQMSSPAVVASNKGCFIISEEDLSGLEKTAECAFRAQIIRNDHCILFYNEPNGFGYKEINFTKSSEFKPVHVKGAPHISKVQKFSTLATAENVHFLYIVKNMSGSRLLYRKRHKTGLSAAVTVCESGMFFNMDSCWLFIIKNRIYAAYMSAGSLYICVSDDEGQSFRKPLKYRNKLCEYTAKAAFLTTEPPDENEFAVREVYVDSLHPWDVQVLPDVYPDFLPVAMFTKDEIIKPEPAAQVTVLPPPAGANPMESWYGADMSEEERLRGQVARLTQEVENQRAVIEKFFIQKQD
jgi:hypothetical protein